MRFAPYYSRGCKTVVPESASRQAEVFRYTLIRTYEETVNLATSVLNPYNLLLNGELSETSPHIKFLFVFSLLRYLSAF